MLSIHLRRTGASGDAHYRVVVSDSRAARDGAFIEVLGHYHPRFEPAKVVLDVERTKEWIARGAQPSDTVRSLLRQIESGDLEAGAAAAQGEATKPEATEPAADATVSAAEEPPAEEEMSNAAEEEANKAAE